MNTAHLHHLSTPPAPSPAPSPSASPSPAPSMSASPSSSLLNAQASEHITPSAHPLLRYQHPQGQRVAELEFHEQQQVWSLTLCDLYEGDQELRNLQRRRVHGLYPSLASAQLILTALGFKELYREASA